MSETWCGSLLLLLVPLVTALNAALIAQVRQLQRQVGGRRNGDDPIGIGGHDG